MNPSEAATERVPLLVDVAWLASHAGDPALRVIDLRWAHKGPSGRQSYQKGHVPGAVFADLDGDLSQPGGPGRHPFPEPAALASTLGRLGIDARTHTVVYDAGDGSIAARLWFMLRVHGLPRVSVLEGGIAAWVAAGLPLSREEAPAAPVAPPQLALDASRLVDRAQVEALLRDRAQSASGPRPLLLDVRAPERYRGEVEPIDPVAGHIPGAVNAPFAGNLRGAGDTRFAEAGALRARYAALGAGEATPLISSCGSGVTACHALLALELAGFPGAKLYVGSWSDWSTAGLPAARGPDPS